MRMPDRIERAVEQFIAKDWRGNIPLGEVRYWLRVARTQEAVYQRGRVRRIVCNGKTSLNPTIAVENWVKGYLAALDYVLAALGNRKGKG